MKKDKVILKKEIILATRNLDKIKEIKKVLSDLKIKLLTSVDFSPFPKIKEDGKTMEENAVKKATIIARFTGKPALADDSGLEVDCLGKRPGVHSARFAGKNCTYDDNNKKLLKLLSRASASQRKARFVCIIAFARPDRPVKIFRGVCAGKISEEIKGKYGFGYDPVFIPRGYKKTFAQLGPGIKNRTSHRFHALMKLKSYLARKSGDYVP